jgi:hypothetical protein
VGVIFFRGEPRTEGEIMKKEYVVDLNEQDLALGEEGYVETEHRKSGRSNTDNTSTSCSTRRKGSHPPEAPGGEGVSRANSRANP